MLSDKQIYDLLKQPEYKHQLSPEDKTEDFWIIPVSWTVVHKLYVPKESVEDLEEALMIAKAADLPPEEIWEYCDDSYQIDVGFLDEENGVEEDETTT